MRNWKRRSRARHKTALRTWSDSESENYNPKLKLRRKWSKRLDVRHARRKTFILKELKTKKHFEDCSFHPCVITTISINNDHIEGASLVTDSSLSACSLSHCGVVFFSEAEAIRRAEYIRYNGMDKYHEVYDSLSDSSQKDVL
jgi:hypothetical protein